MPRGGPWFLDAAKGSGTMLRAFLAAIMLLLLGHGPALADYASGKARFDRLSPEQQTALTLALIATGDFESLAEFGYSRYLYQAIRRFEEREGYEADGVLGEDEIARLKALAENYYGKLGNRYYTHPRTGARILVPRKLFDEERNTEDGMLFTRDDGMLSLSFVSFPTGLKSFEELYATLSASTPDRRVIYKRRFATHFVATGFFTGRKFYTWMARTGGSTTGFTVSWSDEWEETGRKVSVLLANAFLADPR
jgi:hypothetical protein